jgi:phage recombination protein Bet
MTKELIVNNVDIGVIDTLRNTIARDLNDSEFKLFCEIVKATNLNPITKEIWAIKTRAGLQIMTGINGFLRIANSHPQFDGIETEAQWDGGKLVAVTCKVHRKDRRYPATATAYLREYAKPSPIWQQMPSVMLTKCAKSLAIREAFIQQLGGLYTAEEMPSEFSAHNAVGSAPAATVAPTVEPVAAPSEPERVVIITDVDPDSDTLPPGDEVVEILGASSAPVYYCLETCPGDKLDACEAYLTKQGAKRLTETYWKAPRQLEKLTQYIDHSFKP